MKANIGCICTERTCHTAQQQVTPPPADTMIAAVTEHDQGGRVSQVLKLGCRLTVRCTTMLYT